MSRVGSCLSVLLVLCASSCSLPNLPSSNQAIDHAQDSPKALKEALKRARQSALQGEVVSGCVDYDSFDTANFPQGEYGHRDGFRLEGMSVAEPPIAYDFCLAEADPSVPEAFHNFLVEFTCNKKFKGTNIDFVICREGCQNGKCIEGDGKAATWLANSEPYYTGGLPDESGTNYNTAHRSCIDLDGGWANDDSSSGSNAIFRPGLTWATAIDPAFDNEDPDLLFTAGDVCIEGTLYEYSCESPGIVPQQAYALGRTEIECPHGCNEDGNACATLDCSTQGCGPECPCSSGFCAPNGSCQSMAIEETSLSTHPGTGQPNACGNPGSGEWGEGGGELAEGAGLDDGGGGSGGSGSGEGGSNGGEEGSEPNTGGGEGGEEGGGSGGGGTDGTEEPPGGGGSEGEGENGGEEPGPGNCYDNLPAGDECGPDCGCQSSESVCAKNFKNGKFQCLGISKCGEVDCLPNQYCEYNWIHAVYLGSNGCLDDGQAWNRCTIQGGEGLCVGHTGDCALMDYRCVDIVPSP